MASRKRRLKDAPEERDEFDDTDDEDEVAEEHDVHEVEDDDSDGASSDENAEDDEDDSDFENPDDIEVPGGGVTLADMKTKTKTTGTAGIKRGVMPVQGRPSAPPVQATNGAKLQQTNFSLAGPRSVLRRPPPGLIRIAGTPATGLGLASNAGVGGSSSSEPLLLDLTEDDDGVEIVKEVQKSRGPGPSHMGPIVVPAGMMGRQQQQMQPFTPFVQPNVLQAQDPFNMTGAGRGIMLQKYQEEWLKAIQAMQNGGDGAMMRNSANFQHLAGMGMTVQSNLNNMGGGGIYPGSMPVAGVTPPGAGVGASTMPRSAISSLWMNNTPTFIREGPGEDEEVAAEDEEDMGVIETYSNYMPKKLKFGQPHPDPVVETASMASVDPPDVTYKLALPNSVIEKGKLSALQLESVVYACQKHEQFLEDGFRAGFLIGDGAGVGKGRTIAGLIFENFCRGRKRAVWVSVSNDLKYDSERDLRDIGAEDIDVYFLSKMKYAKINSSINNNVRKGIIYSTYSALIGESQTGGKYRTRMKQLLHWCGEDFDGLVVFDECHRAKNLCPSAGAGKPTKTGQAVLELQQKLPKARIVYASATGASEPKHMAYMVRLGIWGRGSPFKTFQEFLGAVEKRGVGAMEIVAMDMKLRGMYIARQLSFQGVSFKIDEVELPKPFRDIYNRAVEFWVDLLHKFNESAELIDADKRMRKTMWAQFWSAHQRFFKYLCIASKVPHVVQLANEKIRDNKCVVIGLQSTGEARTMEALEREEELTDFVSTAKGVLQSLVEKHFPAPDLDRVNKVLGYVKSQGGGSVVGRNGNAAAAAPLVTADGKRIKRKAATAPHKKTNLNHFEDSDDAKSEDCDSEFAVEDEEEEEEDDDDFIDDDDAEEEEDYNPFGDNSDDEDEPWSRPAKKKRLILGRKNKEKSAKATQKADNPYAHIFKKTELSGLNSILSPQSLPSSASNTAPPTPQPPVQAPSASNMQRASQMRRELLQKIEALGPYLPANTLDQLIDELGGPSEVSEMTGRKGRVVQDSRGDVRFESRSRNDVPLETLNLAEKDRFMKGEKHVAIISEAASSGISLQADRRVKNQKRRVHLTLELPWSADRAIQQFGRTHRSNQVSAPEYVLLISDLAGEQRFASIVAKRLESLGALTHGDRRATESRDLSRFNIDNKYGRTALEAVFRAIMGYETPVVKPPEEYKGEFFKDIADGLVGVGLIIQSEDLRGVLTLDKGHNDMSKFLNRILGMKVELQNLLFKYFADTLNAIINQAKRSGRYDQGILDVGLTEEDHVELQRTHTFKHKHATGTAQIELHVLQVERGLSWDDACKKWEELVSKDEGFYLSHSIRNGKKTAVLVQAVHSTTEFKKKGSEKKFFIFRPNTGQQVKTETLSELKNKYKKVERDDAKISWTEQYDSSVKRCSHAYWKGNCKNATLGMRCEVGLRQKTYNVLAGSVLSVWATVEQVLTHDGNRKGTNSKMQVVRLKLSDSRRIVGTLIPSSAMSALCQALSADSEQVEEVIH